MVVIFGGSFNPITLGHIESSLIVSEKLKSDVLITPCFKNKFKNNLVDSIYRLEMCKIASSNYPNIKVSSIEIDSKLGGSTLELIKFVKNSNLFSDFYFLIGMDNANNISTWYNYKELISLAKFIVVPRKGYNEEKEINWYKKEPHIYLNDCNIVESYSTEVRKYFKNNQLEKAKKYLDINVYNYLIKNKLYLL
jgi:nicotinate-nucleotide adenylyltransferase